MKKILISACLLGEQVRYDGKVVPFAHPLLAQWQDQGRLVPVCPEVAGGLGIPRDPAEIQGGDGREVIKGMARVCTARADVTPAFVAGAQIALDTARIHDIQVAILKEKSPSCGSRWIYDGSFTGHKIPGAGVTSALLRSNGIQVFSENEIEQAGGV